jgi:hypothetical protein
MRSPVDSLRSYAYADQLLNLSRDSRDDSRTGVNIRAFPALQQDCREVWMATSSSGSPNDGRGADLAIFTGIWTHSSGRLRLNARDNQTLHAGAGGAISRRISWNICRGMATSAIWKTT